MKKVLLGICGIGNGHIERQKNIIDLLLAKDVKIVIATTRNNIERLKRLYPTIDIIEIIIPWITCNANGVDFSDTLFKYRKSQVNLYEEFLEFANAVEEILVGKPNIVISDYEPNVAQYAYASNIPLINMEQQAKYLYIPEENIDGYGIGEEISRLNYFFPKSNMKIISSFFPLKVESSETKIIVTSPIVKELPKNKKCKKKIIVYLSPYSQNPESYKNLLVTISKLVGFSVVVYTDLIFDDFSYCSQMQFERIGEKFKEDLSTAEFVISTAGHQLISELLLVDVPMMLFPLPTYEQNYNALMVEKYGLGKIIREMDLQEIERFYSKIDVYEKSIQRFKKEFWKSDWRKIVAEELCSLFEK